MDFLFWNRPSSPSNDKKDDDDDVAQDPAEKENQKPPPVQEAPVVEHEHTGTVEDEDSFHPNVARFEQARHRRTEATQVWQSKLQEFSLAPPSKESNDDNPAESSSPPTTTTTLLSLEWLSVHACLLQVPDDQSDVPAWLASWHAVAQQAFAKYQDARRANGATRQRLRHQLEEAHEHWHVTVEGLVGQLDGPAPPPPPPTTAAESEDAPQEPPQEDLMQQDHHSSSDPHQAMEDDDDGADWENATLHIRDIVDEATHATQGATQPLEEWLESDVLQVLTDRLNELEDSLETIMTDNHARRRAMAEALQEQQQAAAVQYQSLFSRLFGMGAMGGH